MLVSLKWLSEYVPLPLPLETLTERLTLAGVMVGKVMSQGDEWEGVRVAQVVDVQPHPNANRPDLLSILGVAWEVATQAHVKVKEPERAYAEAGATTASQRTSVAVEDKDICPRYLAGIVERIKVGPSPEWMQERLRSAGMR